MKHKSAFRRRQKKADYKFKQNILQNKTPKEDTINQVIKILGEKGIKVSFHDNVFTITRTGETFSFDDVISIIAGTV